MNPPNPSDQDSQPSEARPGRFEEAISNPGAVKINVQGAFIVDDEPRSKSPVETDGVHYESKDIRLPHHKGLVSHVAVDVSLPHHPTRENHQLTVDIRLAAPSQN